MGWVVKGKRIERAETVIKTCLKAGAKTAEFRGKEPQSLYVDWKRGAQVTYSATKAGEEIHFDRMLDNDLDNKFTPTGLAP